MAFVYIVRCADDTLYVGHTDDLAAREQLHNSGKGAKYTAARTPVRIVYAEEHASIESAVARERQLKGWSAKKKEALIVADPAALRSLALKSTKSIAAFTWADLLKQRESAAPGGDPRARRGLASSRPPRGAGSSKQVRS